MNIPSSLSFIVPLKLPQDNREPIFHFTTTSDGWFGLDGTFGVYAPNIPYWIETLGMVALQGVLAAVLSVISYKFIVKNQGSWTRYVVGYGLLIPFWTICPIVQIQLLGIENKLMKFCVGGICPTLGIFHTTEAMYGFAPEHTTRTMADYALYWGSPIYLVYDKKKEEYAKASVGYFLDHLVQFVQYLFMLGVIQSLLQPSHFEPFPLPEGEPWYSWKRLFHPHQEANNFGLAVLMQCYLTTYIEGLVAATVLLTGKQCEQVMDNPVFESTTPSEFWTVRWNTLVQGVLKRGVYKPVRSLGYSRLVGVTATFLASGLFHEWLLMFIYVAVEAERGPDGSCPDCGRPIYGGCSAFMLYMALIISLEKTIGQAEFFAGLKRNAPKPVLTLFLLMLGIPVVHWFMEAYITIDFFPDGGVGLPMIKPIGVSTTQ